MESTGNNPWRSRSAIGIAAADETGSVDGDDQLAGQNAGLQTCGSLTHTAPVFALDPISKVCSAQEAQETEFPKGNL
jgi:hypothetical protein